MKKTKTLTKSGVGKTLFLTIFLFAITLVSFSQNTQYGVGALLNNVSGIENSAFGYNALFNNIYGNANVAVGHEALYKGPTQGPPDGSNNVACGVEALRNNSEGFKNSAFGNGALRNNTHGHENVAIGYRSMYLNTDIRFSVACGYEALYSNSGFSVGNVAVGYRALHSNLRDVNTAVGYYALYNNTEGQNNAALGAHALNNNTTGDNNSAFGGDALFNNSTGNNNTAFGNSALRDNSTGYGNSAIGYYALLNNTTGRYNTANGNYALSLNTSGRYNVATGNYAMRDNTTGNFNTAHGTFALYNNITGTQNTTIGYAAGYFSPDNISNATSIGSLAYATASNRVRIGNTSITQIGGQVNWSILSDGRFKNNVEDNVPGIEFIKQLRPVSYNYDYEAYDKHSGFSIEKSSQMDDEAIKAWKEQQKKNEKIVYTGFIAQEVEEIVKKDNYNFSGVVAPENEKDHYSIRYAEFVVPLVKATQQQEEKLDEQNAKIEQLENEIASLKQLVKNLAKNLDPNQEVDVLDSPVKCFPNPNKGIIRLEIENIKQESAEIQVFNMSGNLIYSKRANSNQEIDLSSQPNGTYIIKTKIGPKIYQNKILLQK